MFPSFDSLLGELPGEGIPSYLECQEEILSESDQPKNPAGRKAERLPFSDEAVDLGAELRRLRGDKSLTQMESELKAAGIPISNQSLSNLERGILNPDDARTQRTLKILAGYFKQNIGRFTGAESLPQKAKIKKEEEAVRRLIDKNLIKQLKILEAKFGAGKAAETATEIIKTFLQQSGGELRPSPQHWQDWWEKIKKEGAARGRRLKRATKKNTA